MKNKKNYEMLKGIMELKEMVDYHKIYDYNYTCGSIMVYFNSCDTLIYEQHFGAEIRLKLRAKKIGNKRDSYSIPISIYIMSDSTVSISGLGKVKNVYTDLTKDLEYWLNKNTIGDFLYNGRIEYEEDNRSRAFFKSQFSDSYLSC